MDISAKKRFLPIVFAVLTSILNTCLGVCALFGSISIESFDAAAPDNTDIIISHDNINKLKGGQCHV